MRRRSCIGNATSGHGYPSARVCHPLGEGNDQKRRAPVDCSVIRTRGLGPINARTPRLPAADDPEDADLTYAVPCVRPGAFGDPEQDRAARRNTSPAPASWSLTLVEAWCATRW